MAGVIGFSRTTVCVDLADYIVNLFRSVWGNIEITKPVCTPHGPPLAAQTLSSEFGVQNSELSSRNLFVPLYWPQFQVSSFLS
jgi:poly-beta-hydroxyalkanoate depolymerase